MLLAYVIACMLLIWLLSINGVADLIQSTPCLLKDTTVMIIVTILREERQQANITETSAT